MIADCTAVLEMPDAPPGQKAWALYNRGLTYGQQGDSEKAIADYNAVLDMPDAPDEQKARALVNRGARYGQQGDSEKAIADYTAVLDMSDPSRPRETARRIREAIDQEPFSRASS